MRSVESFKLGVVIDVDGRRGRTELQQTDKATTQLTGSVQKLGSEFKKAGGLTAGFSAGFKSAASNFQKDIQQFSKTSRLNAIGNIAGTAIGNGMQDGIMSVLGSLGSTVGSIIGTAIAPGLGTAVGSTVGSAVDAALAKAAGIVGPLISKGLEYNKRLELELIHYTTFTGSLKEAKQHIDFLKKESMVSFDLPTWLSASQRLEEFNHDIKLTQLELKAAKDQTAAFRPDDLGYFNALLDTLGLITERGELTSRELNKIRRMGLDVPQMLSEETGWSPAKIEKMIKAGELRGEAVARMIATNIERHKGGFADLIDSTTLSGREGSFKEGLNQRAQEGTVNLARGISEFYKAANDILSGPNADKFVNFINDTAGAVIGVIEKGVHVGAGVSQGVVQGIQSGESVNALKTSISAMGSLAIDTLKTEWRINSPSLVFAELGGGAMEGLAKGVLDNEGLLTGALSHVLNNASNQTRAWASSLGLDKNQSKVFGNMQRLFAKEPDFLPKLIQGARARGINPDHLLNVMAVETAGSFDPQARNPNSSASGLIQFMRDTARTLGTTIEAIRKMNATQQLDYVFKYLDQKKFNGKLTSQGALYSAVGTGIASNDNNAVVMRRGDRGYAGNYRTWDVNRDGEIRQSEMAVAPFQKLGAGWKFSVNGTAISNSNPLPVTLSAGQTWQDFARRSIAELRSGEQRNYYDVPDIVGGASEGVTKRIVEVIPAFTSLKKIVGELNTTFPEAEAFIKRLNTEGVTVVQTFGDMGIGVPPVTDAFKALRKEVVKATEAEKKKNREEAKKKREKPGFFTGKKFNNDEDEDGAMPKVGPAKMAIRGLKSALADLKQMGKDSFDLFAQGIGGLVENFVLLGESGPDALRKLAAQAVASLAAQSAVQAVYWTAQGIVDLFWNPARAAADFAGAALFASIAGLSILGGRALAGNLFSDQSGQSQADANQQYASEDYAGNKFTRRATGGPAYRGRSYLVGDGGRTEVFEPNTDGYVHSSLAAYARAQERRGQRGSSGGGSSRTAAILERVAAALERFETMPAHEVVTLGARKAASAIAEANTRGLRKSNKLINDQGRVLNLA